MGVTIFFVVCLSFYQHHWKVEIWMIFAKLFCLLLYFWPTLWFKWGSSRFMQDNKYFKAEFDGHWPIIQTNQFYGKQTNFEMWPMIHHHGKSIFRRKQSWSLKATPNCLMVTAPSRKPFTKIQSILLPSSCVGLWLIFLNPSSCKVERKSGFSLLKSQLMSPQIIVGLSGSTSVGILSFNDLLWVLL